MRVNYIYKKENDRRYFSSSDSITELKEYIDDLVFYTPANNVDRAEFALSDPIAKYEVKPELFTGGPFGTYFKIKDKYSFDIKNFDSLIDNNARISFWLGTNKINEAQKVFLKIKDKYKEKGLPRGEYSFTVTVAGQPTSTMTINCTAEFTSVSTFKNKILFKLDPTIYPFEVNIANKEKDVIVLQSAIKNRTIKISDGLDGYNLLDYFDISAIQYGSSPEEEIDIFKLFNLKISHFKNIETGSDQSYLRFTISEPVDEVIDLEPEDNWPTIVIPQEPTVVAPISDGLNDMEIPDTPTEEKVVVPTEPTIVVPKERKTPDTQIIEVPWNSDSIHLDNIEIDFDSNVVYIFINGKLEKIELLKYKFQKTNQTLTLSGHNLAPYSFDEIIINKHFIHTKDFEKPDYQLTKYTTKKPYVDYYFAGSQLKDGMGLLSNSYNNIHATICENGNFYYYNTGAWRRGDGTFSTSNDFSTFSEKIKEFNYNGTDIFIRCFFVSNGTDKAYLDVPYFEIDDELYQDENGNTAAILIGSKEWSEDNEPLIEDMYGKVLTITTDAGTTTIEFLPKDENRTSLPMSLSEIIDKINSYYPDGIATAKQDSKSRAVLISETKGEDAFINVSGSAAPIIFGTETTAKGKNPNSGSLSYDEFCKKVRTYTGEPLITLEISDEQIKLYLKEALAYYKRWKGDCINQYTCQLKGDWENGYEIPKVIENQRDIVDILFKPVFPITFYGADLIADGDENIFTLTLAQTIFGGRGGRQADGVQQDFYVSLMGMQDFKQTFGLNPTWEIINNRIYIFPSQISRFTNVAIKYKAPLSEEEALQDPDILKYVFARSCLALGMIRGQYGSNLSVGEAALTFNADTLIELGKQYMKEVMDYFMSVQPPLGFIVG